MPILQGTGGCKGNQAPEPAIDSEVQVFCDSTDTQFLVVPQFDDTGALTGVINILPDGSTYTPVGNTELCTADTVGFSSVLLCDSGNNNKPYMACITKNLTLNTVTVTTTELDGTTAYTPVTPNVCKVEPFVTRQVCLVANGTLSVAPTFEVREDNVLTLLGNGIVQDFSADPVSRILIETGYGQVFLFPVSQFGTTTEFGITPNGRPQLKEGQYEGKIHYITEKGQSFSVLFYYTITRTDNEGMLVQSVNVIPEDFELSCTQNKYHQHVLCDGTVKGIYEASGNEVSAFIAEQLGSGLTLEFNCPELKTSTIIPESFNPFAQSEIKKIYITEQVEGLDTYVAVYAQVFADGSVRYNGNPLGVADYFCERPHNEISRERIEVTDQIVVPLPNIPANATGARIQVLGTGVSAIAYTDRPSELPTNNADSDVNGIGHIFQYREFIRLGKMSNPENETIGELADFRAIALAGRNAIIEVWYYA